jgi:hypothetical protein
MGHTYFQEDTSQPIADTSAFPLQMGWKILREKGVFIMSINTQLRQVCFHVVMVDVWDCLKACDDWNHHH